MIAKPLQTLVYTSNDLYLYDSDGNCVRLFCKDLSYRIYSNDGTELTLTLPNTHVVHVDSIDDYRAMVLKDKL